MLVNKLYKFTCVIIAIILTTAIQLAWATIPSPVGYWQTIDDETGKPRSIVQIVETKNHWLYGRVIQVNYFTGEKYTDVCNLCAKTDPRYNRLNLGLIVLDALQPTSNARMWDNGKALDPHNGKVYDAKLTLSPDGNTLIVRGYIGISLLGRNQTWTRILQTELQPLFGQPVKILTDGIILTNKDKYLAPGYHSAAPILKALHEQ